LVRIGRYWGSLLFLQAGAKSRKETNRPCKRPFYQFVFVRYHLEGGKQLGEKLPYVLQRLFLLWMIQIVGDSVAKFVHGL
jgi:hypothetical protein